MKTVKNILYTILAFIIIYILQSQFFNYFSIAEIKPNLFILLIIFIALNTNKYFASLAGIIIGLFIDIIIGNGIGLTSISYLILAFVISQIERYLSRQSKITSILLILFGTIGVESLQYLLNIIFNKINFEIIMFLKISTIEAIYNSILLIIIYPIWKKFVCKNETNLNKNISRYL